MYCRLGILEKMPRNVFTNHNFGDKKCTSISQQDRNQYESSKLSNMTDYTRYNDADEEIARLTMVLTTMTVTTITSMLMTNDDDDDKKKIADP